MKIVFSFRKDGSHKFNVCTKQISIEMVTDIFVRVKLLLDMDRFEISKKDTGKLMTHKYNWYIFGFGIALGVVLLAYFMTGINITYPDLIIHTFTGLIDNIPHSAISNQLVSNWNWFATIATLAVAIAPLLSFITLVYFTGKRGVVLFLLGFQLFPLFLIASKTIVYLGLVPVILFIIGIETCEELEGTAPRDYISRWLE